MEDFKESYNILTEGLEGDYHLERAVPEWQWVTSKPATIPTDKDSSHDLAWIYE